MHLAPLACRMKALAWGQDACAWDQSSAALAMKLCQAAAGPDFYCLAESDSNLLGFYEGNDGVRRGKAQKAAACISPRELGNVKMPACKAIMNTEKVSMCTKEQLETCDCF